MSLPKRDGVHDRYYLIHKPDTSPEVLAEADLCIQDVLNGTARENHSAYPTVVRNHNGTPFLPDQLLERYLTELPLKGFPCEDAVSLCDAMRRLVGWQEIRYTLEKYIEKQVQERFFLVGERDDGFTVFPPCTVLPELRPEDVDGIVFWSKNPAPLMPHLRELNSGYTFYFQFTITIYGREFEPGLPAKEEVIATFKRLSEQLGRERVIWRCDPFIFRRGESAGGGSKNHSGGIYGFGASGRG